MKCKFTAHLAAIARDGARVEENGSIANLSPFVDHL